MAFDEAAIRADFPILQRRLRCADGQERPLCYLDHAASTHAPRPVLDAVRDLHENSYANVHRGRHALSTESSDLLDGAAATLLRFLGADADAQQVVWAQNTTMALDIAAHVLAAPGVRTLTTLAEHHSNDLPHRKRGGPLHVDVDDDGRILLDDLAAKLQGHDVGALALSGASNVTGFLPPLARIARLCSETETTLLVDAAQLYAHAPIRMRPKGHPEHIPFLAAAGHKSYAPFGGAALVGDREAMDAAPPYLPGGGTVEWVTESSALFTTGPDRHVGGTPNLTGAVAFAAATRYLEAIGMDEVRSHEAGLVRHALDRFGELSDRHAVRLLGPAGPWTTPERLGVLSFTVPGVHHEEVSALLDRHHAIATRNGCFCAHPLLHRLLRLGDTSKWIQAIERGEPTLLPGAARASFGLYTTRAEVDLLADAVAEVASGKLKPAPQAEAGALAT